MRIASLTDGWGGGRMRSVGSPAVTRVTHPRKRRARIPATPGPMSSLRFTLTGGRWASHHAVRCAVSKQADASTRLSTRSVIRGVLPIDCGPRIDTSFWA